MILHIDMDAFYASVEQRDDPGLQGKCVIVGGLSRRSVVSAASYEARKFGVHSAMPMFQARQKCPHAIFLRPRMDRYKAVSDKIMALLGEFSPQVEPVSIDEAFVDIAGTERLHGGAVEIATCIKKRIKDAVGLTCSVGGAPSKFMAKIASDMKKPDGLTILRPEQVPEFLKTLPISKIPGVGKARLEQLGQMGIKTLGDVHTYPKQTLFNRLDTFGRRLLELSSGIDGSPVNPFSRRKSVSTEETLERDTDDRRVLAGYLLEQSETVAKMLRKKGVRAKTITLKLKHADFRLVTRSVTLPVPTQSSDSVYAAVSRLLDTYPAGIKIRLVGVGASGLISESVPVQKSLFDATLPKRGNWEKVDRAVDSITRKYGEDAIKRGTLKAKRTHDA